MKKLGIFLMLATMVGFASCDNEEDENMFVNGTYMAEAAEFSHNWKEFMEVTIKGDEVTVVNYDSKDAEGVLKSSLTEYPMPDPPGLPSAWYPILEAQYVALDITKAFTGVDGVSGATGTSGTSEHLFEAILEAAKEGDTSTQVVEIPE